MKTPPPSPQVSEEPDIEALLRKQERLPDFFIDLLQALRDRIALMRPGDSFAITISPTSSVIPLPPEHNRPYTSTYAKPSREHAAQILSGISVVNGITEEETERRKSLRAQTAFINWNSLEFEDPDVFFRHMSELRTPEELIHFGRLLREHYPDCEVAVQKEDADTAWGVMPVQVVYAVRGEERKRLFVIADEDFLNCVTQHQLSDRVAAVVAQIKRHELFEQPIEIEILPGNEDTN